MIHLRRRGVRRAGAFWLRPKNLIINNFADGPFRQADDGGGPFRAPDVATTIKKILRAFVVKKSKSYPPAQAAKATPASNSELLNQRIIHHDGLSNRNPASWRAVT